MDTSQTFKDTQDKITSALVQTTRTVGRIFQEDISFQRSLDAAVSRSLDGHGERLLGIARRLIEKAGDRPDLDPLRLTEQDDLENNWSGIVDVIDSLLERADTSLDEHTGRIKRAGNGERGKVCGNAP